MRQPVQAQGSTAPWIRGCTAALFSLIALSFPARAQCNAQKYVDSIGECGQSVGRDMALDGDRAVVGAPMLGSPPQHTGGAFVLEHTPGGWSEAALLLADDGQGSDLFGEAVSLSQDTIVVGAHQSSPLGKLSAGSAYVFEFIGGSWVQTQKLIASDVAADARFGWSVAIDGDTLVVGARQASITGTLSGAVYVFERQGGWWTETARLVGSDSTSYDGLGNVVDISGNRIVASAQGQDGGAQDAGAVYVFEKLGSRWLETAKIIAPDPIPLHNFGGALELDGGRLFIGADRDKDLATNSGAVYAFELVSTSWVFRQKLYSMLPAWQAKFGRSVAVSGSNLVVGESSAWGLDDRTGAIYIFRETEAGWVGLARFIAPDGEAYSFLGSSVGASGPHVAGGAPEAANGSPISNCFVGNVWLLDVPPHATPFCFGVGCPCGNDDPVAGCAGSGGKGARLAGCGSGSVAADDATFDADGLPPGNVSLLFRGLDAINGGAGMPFGDGLRCAGTQVLRLGIRFADAAGHATWGPGLAAQGSWQPGDTMRLQAWYRDPQGSPCGPGFNTTNAVETLFGP